MKKSPRPTYLEPALEYIDSWLETQTFLDRQTPGYSVAISHDGEILYSRGFGYANLEQEEPMTTGHLFRIASHSKTFTATAIMQLMEAGKLALDDPASTYLPFLNDNPDPRVARVTIKHMLQHSSGMWRDGEDASFWTFQRDFPNKEDVIAFFTKEPLAIDSGTRFKYSNYAYALLGQIIEAVSGSSYNNYITSEILRPLGLTNITTEYNADTGPHITGYTALAPNGDQAPIPAAVNTDGIMAAGGFCANAESLCLFYSAMMPGSGKLLSDTSKQEMLREHWEILDDPVKRGYGLGFKSEYLGDRHLNGHGGGMPGNITRTLFDTDDRIVVSILSNAHSGDPTSLQSSIWHILDMYKSEYDPASPFLKYHGQFFDIWGTAHYVPLGNKIYVTLPKTTQPFKDCSILEHVKDHIFTPTKESGYGNYGQNVEFIMDGNTVNSVNYAGFPKMNRADYEAHIAELKKI
jgi:D-alanyl-D-alanine carboxypeptidase